MSSTLPTTTRSFEARKPNICAASDAPSRTTKAPCSTRSDHCGELGVPARSSRMPAEVKGCAWNAMDEMNEFAATRQNRRLRHEWVSERDSGGEKRGKVED